MEELESMELCQCICTELHLNCNANTCKEAAIRRSTKLFLPPVCPGKESYPLVSGLGDISSRDGQWALDTNLLRVRDSMGRGCTTCALIYEGLVNEMDASEHSEFKLTHRSGHVELDPDMDMYYDLYVAEDSSYFRNCKAFPPEMRRPESTSSPLSFGNISAWIADCERRHSCASNTLVPLPSRVIDVRRPPTNASGNEDDVRLCETSGMKGKYAALSHCWGPNPIITTKKCNLEDHYNSISWDALSRTFKDAITIARILGISYIWIDSLCIIQDDKDDWMTESVKMRDIYKGSYLTISADHAKDGSGGCFSQSDPEKSEGFEISLAIDPHVADRVFIREQWSHHGFEPGETWFADSVAPIDTRGWTLQERMLSTRIIHYTDRELIWECNSAIHCQCRRVDLQHPFNPKLQFSAVTETRPALSRLMTAWEGVVMQFSRRALTQQTDCLVALSGLAKQFIAAGAYSYLAGLWRPVVRESAIWLSYGYRNRRPETFIAPSWSWAAVVGPIILPSHQLENHLYRRYPVVVLSAATTPAIPSEPTSLVSSGHLTVAAQAVTCTLTIDPGVAPENGRYFLLTSSRHSVPIDPDAPAEMDELPPQQPLLCVLWSVQPARRWANPAALGWLERRTFCLVLQRTGMEYRRVGVVRMPWLEKIQDVTYATGKLAPGAVGKAYARDIFRRAWWGKIRIV